MTDLSKRLLASVDALGGPGEATAADRLDRLTMSVDAADRLAVSFTRCRLETTRLAGASADEVRATADRLTERVRYLLEPIAPIEFDHQRAVVQLRSVAPTAGENGAEYYELLVEAGGSATLVRFRKSPGRPRESISATLTREVIGRLASDLVDCVGG